MSEVPLYGGSLHLLKILTGGLGEQVAIVQHDHFHTLAHSLTLTRTRTLTHSHSLTLTHPPTHKHPPSRGREGGSEGRRGRWGTPTIKLHIRHSNESRPTMRGTLYRGTSLIRNSALLGPYSRTMPRAPW